MDMTFFELDKLIKSLEALRIDVDVECAYCDPTGALQDKYNRANEMLDDCIDCVRQFWKEN